MSLPSINQDAMEEVSPEENLQSLSEMGGTRVPEEKRVVVKWMLHEGLGPIQMSRRLPTISKNTFCKWRLKERHGLTQRESRKDHPKILYDAALEEYRDQYDGTKGICKLSVL